MCGIVGIVGHGPVNQRLYDALTVLQHRGQDAAGIVTSADGRLYLRKDNGLVRDVFQQSDMQQLAGNMGIGHCRYPTAGTMNCNEAQPFYVNSPYGITLAHNGNLTNADQLAQELFRADLRHINTSSDSEVLLNVFAHELQVRGKLRPTEEDVFAAVEGVHRRCQGAYAVVAMITGYGVVAFRDPLGVRPLVFGQRETDMGSEYMLASESVALDVLGFRLVGDVAAGEAVYVDAQGFVHRRSCAAGAVLTPCIFEHVYLARPDSIMDDVSIYKTRLRQGEHLAEKIRRTIPHHDVDVVVPIPDTARTAAMAMAHELNLKYREALVKNRYIGRTFIMPEQQQRKDSVRRKLNPIPLEFKGKNVLLVDDSIVRGTTSKQIVQMAREAGANRVYYCSAAAEVRYPNVYGIDMPAAHELIAHERSADEVCRLIGADWLVYQDLADLIACSREGNPAIERFETSIFDGQYLAGHVDAGYLGRLERVRSDSTRTQASVRVERIGPAVITNTGNR